MSLGWLDSLLKLSSFSSLTFSFKHSVCSLSISNPGPYLPMSTTSNFSYFLVNSFYSKCSTFWLRFWRTISPLGRKEDSMFLLKSLSSNSSFSTLRMMQLLSSSCKSQVNILSRRSKLLWRTKSCLRRSSIRSDSLVLKFLSKCKTMSWEQ
jgi:hypothetical protein